jgi:hypothetical protein
MLYPSRRSEHFVRSAVKLWFCSLIALLLVDGKEAVFAVPVVEAGARSLPQEKMVRLPAGDYLPLFQDGGTQGPVQVAAFDLDAYAVTNAA